MENDFDRLKESFPESAGLSPKDHGYLNDYPIRTKQENFEIFAAKRKEYANNPKALQQIDVYDGESPYHPKLKEYVSALTSGDTAHAAELEIWLRENYPDI